MSWNTRQVSLFSALLLILVVLAGCGGGGGGSSSGRIVFDSNRDGTRNIFIMNPDGTGVTNLTGSAEYEYSPCLSQDGTKIAYISGIQIWIMNDDGSGKTQLTFESSNQGPSISYDGSRIAFTSYRDGNYEVYTMLADGTGQTRLTNDPAQDGAPAFSPDGTKIAFYSLRGGSQQIYIMNADGTGTATQLTNASRAVTGPVFRPDGLKIAYSLDAEPTEIWTVDVGGSGAAYLAVGGSACYSPDGSRMVCTDHVAGSDAEIFVMNADGTNKTNITNSAAEDQSPYWGN